MPEAVIVAQYVNQPQAGKKHGSIKTPEGQYYGVPPAMLGMFKPNGTYKVFYESRDYQGKTYHTVKTVSEVMAPPMTPASPLVVGGHQSERSMEIWINSMSQCAAKTGHLDLWSEEAHCEFGEIQKRVYRRLFLGESAEPRTTLANGPAHGPGVNPHATGPAPGYQGQKMDSEMDDQIPFISRESVF